MQRKEMRGKDDMMREGGSVTSGGSNIHAYHTTVKFLTVHTLLRFAGIGGVVKGHKAKAAAATAVAIDDDLCLNDGTLRIVKGTV